MARVVWRAVLGPIVKEYCIVGGEGVSCNILEKSLSVASADSHWLSDIYLIYEESFLIIDRRCADIWHRDYILRRMCCASSVDISAYFMDEGLHHFTSVFEWEGVRKRLDFQVENNIFIGDNNISHSRIKPFTVLSEDFS